ncbi:unnamed protein product [Ambrosiozyma monospora]|uniref:Unnamed protein product n=1 Tax=Ambrosiozyma monospora TaxID=43982 RepID=A0A9W6YZ58_AMBMO|nr:unnamed protein product [Ambrosiozyma monospora]
MSTSFMAADKNDVTQSLVDSIMFSTDNATGSAYMSANSNFFDAKSSLSNAHSENHKPSQPHGTVLAYINQLECSFEGLQPIDNFKVEIDSVKVAATPLPECLVSLIESFKHLNKLSNMRKKSVDEDDDFDSIEKKNKILVESFTISQILVSLTSAINFSGEFAETNDIRLVAGNINIEQKNSSFILGGVEELKIVKVDRETDIFHFEDSKLQTPDLKFEILQSDVVRTTILCSKSATLDIDPDVLKDILVFAPRLSPLFESLGDLNSSSQKTSNSYNALISSSYYQSVRSSRNPSSPLHLRETAIPNNSKDSGEKSELIAQTSTIYVNLHISDTDSISSTIFPLSFNSLTGLFDTDKVVADYNGAESYQMLLLSELKSQSHASPLNIKSYDFTSQHDVNFTSSHTTVIDSVYLNIDSKLLSQLNDMIDYITPEPAKEDKSSPKPKRKGKKKVRMGGSLLFGGSQILKNFVTIKQTALKLANVNEEFGDLEVNFSNFRLAFHKDNSLTFDLRDLHVGRRKMYTAEPLISLINKDERDHPPLSGKFRDSLSLHLRNVYIDYYTKWIPMFDNNNNEDNKNTGNDVLTNSISGISELSPNKKPKSKFDIKISFSDFIIGLIPLTLASKAILVVKKGNGEISLNADSTVSIKSSFSTISVQLIDDTANIVGDEQMSRFRRLNPSWTMVSLMKSKGYVTVAHANSLFLLIQINTPHSSSHVKSELKPVIDISTNLNDLNIDVCADSFNCLVQLLKELKEPIVFKFSEKYKPSNEPVDVFDLVDDDYYAPKNPSISQASSSVDGSSSTREPLNIVDDFYATKAESESEIPSITHTSAGSNSMSCSGGDVLIDESHFNNSDVKDSKIIPMSFTLGIQKVNIKLYDGYDWKQTQNQLIKAIERVHQRVKETGMKQKPSDTSSHQSSVGSKESSSGTKGRHKSDGSTDNFNHEIEENNEVIGEMLN